MSDEKLRALIARWGREWGLPDLVSEVSVTFSGRLTRSLGRCRPAAGQVTLRRDLRDRDPDRLEEVLCHEVAHIAVDRLFGRDVSPHGPEWRDLVRRAGFEPRVRAAETVDGMDSRRAPEMGHPADGTRGAATGLAGETANSPETARAAEPVPQTTKARRSPGVLEYEHRCPVCQSVRFARRPVPRWRCAECLDAGLTGELVITRHPTSARDS